MNYFLQVGIMLEIYIILALSLNLVAGTTGLLSLGQGVMYGIGAYTTAILSTRFQMNFFFTLPFSISAGVLFSFVLGYFASRLRDLYFTLATLAFQVILYTVFYNSDFTGGPNGITGIAQPVIFGFQILSLKSFAMLSSTFLLLSLFFFNVLRKMPLQRAMECVRDDDLEFRSLGKNPSYYKYSSLAIAAIFSSIAGSLYAVLVTYVDATSFSIDESILLLAICILGGSGTIAGSIAGAIFYVILPEVLRFAELPKSDVTNLRLMIFAIVLILTVRFRPKGLFGKYEA
jgi:branched-chain amino acid transport system permease protein